MSTSPLAPATDRWGDRLPRRLGFWSAVSVLVGSTIGGGIFRTPAVIAERVPASLPMFGVWVLGGLLALCGALTYAELAALFPRSGGVYGCVREGAGRLEPLRHRGGPGHPRPVRPRTGLGAVGVRWLGRSLVRGRRGAESGAKPAACAGGGDGRHHRDLPARQRGVSVPLAPRPDGAVPAGSGRRGAGGARPDRDRRSIGRGDARDLLDPRWVDPHGAPHLFRDGGRRAVLPRHREGASALPDALRGDRVNGLSGRGIRVAPHVRAAGRPVRGGDFSVLCARGGGGVRAAPPAPRSAPAGAHARLSGGATAVRARDLRHSR